VYPAGVFCFGGQGKETAFFFWRLVEKEEKIRRAWKERGSAICTKYEDKN
jgi:hypothetical protein